MVTALLRMLNDPMCYMLTSFIEKRSVESSCISHSEAHLEFMVVLWLLHITQQDVTHIQCGYHKSRMKA